MKLFTCGLATETNSFSPVPTTLDDFTVIRGGVSDAATTPFEAPLAVFRDLARARDWSVVEGPCAYATPSGPTTDPAYQALRDEILAALDDALPVDAVLMNLHGSMQSVSCPDVEGDLISRVRERVGAGVPIGAELDLHCHPTTAMLEAATALVIYKHWPHVDSRERAAELFRVVAGAAEGGLRPRTSVFNTRMIGLYPTEREPMSRFVARMKARESGAGVLSISFAHDHPWTDAPELGARVVVITDDREQEGAALAGELGREIYAMRDEVAWHFPTLDQGLDEALDGALVAGRKPVVLVDMSDNPGGGAPGDGTQVLEALLARGVSGAAVCLWDARVVEEATRAGVGATLDVTLGGRSGSASGRPLELRAAVTAIQPGLTQRSLVAAREMGDAVALRVGEVDVVVTSLRAATHSPDCFAKLGIDPGAKRLLVAKTLNNALPGFDEVAARYVWVDGGGACPGDVRRIRFRHHEPGLWPYEEDPLG